MVDFDAQTLGDRLENLSPRFRMLFSLAVAERLFPLYHLFFEKTGRGSPSYLRSTLDHLWQLAREGLIGHEEPFLKDYEGLISGEDPQWHPLDGLADAEVSALAYASYCEATGDTPNAVWAAECGYEAVDYIAHTLEDMPYDTPDAEAAILKKDYVQAEIERQLRDVTELENAPPDGPGIERIVRTFRDRATLEGTTLLPLVSALLK